MSRYIDADALIDKVDKYIYRITRASKLKVGESAIIADIKAHIELSPTIDAVPLDGSFLKMSKGDYLIYKRHWLYEHFDQEIDIQRSVMKSMGYEYVGKNTDTVRHGKWVVEDGHVCCSECGEISKEYNYCPYCGARMDKDDR